MYVLASENAGHAAQAVADPGIVDILLWGVLPYVALVILIGGTIWLIAAIWQEHKGIGSTCNLFVACHALVAA